jgi:probable F420-dependent oxidoreductase
MLIGLMPLWFNPIATAEHIAAVARAADERGFHSLWAGEHVVLFDEYASCYPYTVDGQIPISPGRGLLDPFGTLSFVAGITSRIRLCTGVCLVPQRNPVYTAKEAATVDWLSNGRLELGVGIGWLAEEFAALGAPWPRRAARTRSYLQVMRSLWCDDVSEYEDEFYTLPACRQYPKPLQRPHPPIVFGGESEAALRRVAELGQGWYGINVDTEDAVRHVASLARMLDEHGRRRDDVQLSVTPPRRIDTDDLAAYQRAGIDQVILPVFGRTTADAVAAVDELAAKILEPARALA